MGVLGGNGDEDSEGDEGEGLGVKRGFEGEGRLARAGEGRRGSGGGGFGGRAEEGLGLIGAGGVEEGMGAGVSRWRGVGRWYESCEGDRVSDSKLEGRKEETHLEPSLAILPQAPSPSPPHPP